MYKVEVLGNREYCGVSFTIGNQSFRLDVPQLEEDEVSEVFDQRAYCEWYANQLRAAFASMESSFQKASDITCPVCDLPYGKLGMFICPSEDCPSRNNKEKDNL